MSNNLPRFGQATLARTDSAPTLGPRPTSRHQLMSPQRPPVGHVLSPLRVWGDPQLYVLPDVHFSKSPRRPRPAFCLSPQRPVLTRQASLEAAAFKLYAPPRPEAYKQPRAQAVQLRWGGASDHGRGHQTVAHTALGTSSVGGLTNADDRPHNHSDRHSNGRSNDRSG